MHPLAIPCLAMSAINAYLALYHVTLALLRPQAREHLPFAMLCASVAAYDVFCLGLYSSTSLAQGVFWQRLQLEFIVEIAIGTVWFVARFTGTEKSRVVRGFIAWFLVLTPLPLIELPGLTVSVTTPAIKEIVWGGRPLITYYESDVGAISLVMIATALAAYLYSVVLLIRYYRVRQSRHALAILAGNVAYFVGVVNDSLIASRVYPFVYVSEYAFLVLTLSMAYVLLGRFVGLQRDVEALNGSLERTVEQRTAALQQSLEQQRAMQEQLVAASRRSGRADVASDVLHNVGNALNSVNVSVDVLETAVQRSRLAGLSKVIRILSDHRGDLPGFFATDHRAPKLPDYLVASTAQLEAEQAQLAGELRSLRGHVEHVNLVIATQQAYLGAPAPRERTALADVLDDALRDAGARHAAQPVALETSYDAVPELELDRHKLVPVVAGLLDNAWHALAGAEPTDRRIRVRLRAATGERVAIEVEDSGRGIARDDLTRIFQHSATSRAEHGVDLHACACAAGELGGTLAAASDGLGRGARFTLTLPLRAAGPDAPGDPAAHPAG